jgi:hypothetical protein
VEGYYGWGKGEPRHELSGVYDVTDFRRAGQAVLDEQTWRRLAITNHSVTILSMGNGRDVYSMEYDPNARRMELHHCEDEDRDYTLSLTRVAPDVLQLEGIADGEPIAVRLQVVDESSFLLVNRGFHWISERALLR